MRSNAPREEPGRRRLPRLGLILGLGAPVCLAVLLSIPSTRGAISDFLGLFRLRKFALVSLETGRPGEEPVSEEGLIRSGLGEPIVLREAGEPESVSRGAETDRRALKR